GMSGGTAYVLDLDEALLNRDMVDVVDIDTDDAAALRTLVVRHHEETESAVAERLLADWDAALPRFAKVLPRDYAKVLKAQSQAKSDGLDDDQTTIKMMEAAHG
ncbi:MAG: hypothetical protein ACR2LI_08940, partial [Propionibacteriaceae bacterium]